MKGTMYILKPDTPPLRRDFDHEVPYHTMRAALDDGPLETVPYFDVYEGQPCVAFCDEDGKGKGLPINKAATILWAMAYHKRTSITIRDIEAMNDILVGPVIILTGDAEFMASL